ncbi:hypothetical protein R3P38DRAFT_2857077 [Favolaschia claudopus]|uniref:F-box domain-containing protein n=1 Tax=Favolaschia claudopus TaxID=2862362 RepID=A0AAW0DJR8_9AGAR
MPQNPLNVQELREHCIGFLAGSPESLMSCALVARSWVDAAQANLFRAPLLINWRILVDAPTATRFYDAINSSPHLARYVRAIGIQQGWYSTALIENICSISFPRLESLYVVVFNLVELEPQLRPIMSLPTLQHLHLVVNNYYFSPSTIVPLLARLPSTCQYLDLRCYQWDPSKIPSKVESASRIKLLYLRLDIMPVFYPRATPPQRLQSTSLHPFDLGHLKSLEVQDSCSLVWDSIPPATRSAIEVLHLGISGSTAVDLSTFPNLQLLRLRLPYDDRSLAPVLRTLSSITAHHQIRTIILFVGDSDLEEKECRELDQVLAFLPISPHPMIAFEVPITSPVNDSESKLQKFFPLLVSHNKFHMACGDWDISNDLPTTLERRLVYEPRIML